MSRPPVFGLYLKCTDFSSRRPDTRETSKIPFLDKGPEKVKEPSTGEEGRNFSRCVGEVIERLRLGEPT